MSNIIIFGGTFDPIHNGHLRIIKHAQDYLKGRVILVPAKTPCWKNPTESSMDRLEMIKIALKSYNLNDVIVSEYELNACCDINYSIDTLKHFKQTYKNDNIYLIIGADQANLFHKWKDADLISKMCQVVYINRPDYSINEANIKKYSIESLDFNSSGDISSSKIRSLQDVDTPIEVLEYIETNKLYYIQKISKYITEERLQHSIQVARLAYDICLKNNLDIKNNAYIAGILHDIGKSFKYPREAAIKFMQEKYADYVNLPLFSYHQFIGSDIIQQEFNIIDEDILNAVRFHCTGRANMTPLGMIVYASDKIEPTREFDSTFLINSCYNNYLQGFIDTLEDNRKYLLSHDKDIYNFLTKECMDMYLKGEKE